MIEAWGRGSSYHLSRNMLCLTKVEERLGMIDKASPMMPTGNTLVKGKINYRDEKQRHHLMERNTDPTQLFQLNSAHHSKMHEHHTYV